MGETPKNTGKMPVLLPREKFCEFRRDCEYGRQNTRGNGRAGTSVCEVRIFFPRREKIIKHIAGKMPEFHRGNGDKNGK